MRVINKNSCYHMTFDGEMNFAMLRYCNLRDLDRETYGLFVKNNSTSGIVAIPPHHPPPRAQSHTELKYPYIGLQSRCIMGYVHMVHWAEIGFPAN